MVGLRGLDEDGEMPPLVGADVVQLEVDEVVGHADVVKLGDGRDGPYISEVEVVLEGELVLDGVLSNVLQAVDVLHG